jgi:leader peptidase (prepilin peptidase) / N-methyltransferase
MLFWEIYWAVVIFWFGISWGSFLNVCIYRIPEELSVVKPRSRCPKCGYSIPWYDNIPLFSWLMLGGKCRQCKVAISPRYFVVELLTGLLFVWVWLLYSDVESLMLLDGSALWADGGAKLLFVPYTIMIFGLILGTFVDIDHMILPDRTTIGGMIAGGLLSFIFPAMHGETAHLQGLLQSVYGMAFGFGILWSVSILGRLILRKDAMGFGDVKLMGALGAFLGIPAVLFIIFISSLLGSVVGVTLIAMGKRDAQARIPFGPYIAAAAVIWIFGGYGWWDLYLNWIYSTASY